MASNLAKVRFIADSTAASFRGSNAEEAAEIENIRRVYAPYLYSNKPPKRILAKLAPVADKLLRAATVDSGGSVDSIVGMYELR